MRQIITIGLMLIWCGGALASPPAKDSEDWLIMRDYAAWVEMARAKGAPTSCCGIADGRPLFAGEWKEGDGGHYFVFISRRHWETAPEVGFWIEVPSEAVLPASPVGLPIVWWQSAYGSSHGIVFCFAPVGGV
jgi:hypothetical protein